MPLSTKLTIIVSIVVVTVFTSFVYHISQKADINYYLGHRFFVRGEYEKAIPLFERSAEEGSRRVETYKELAYSYLWTGRSERSIILFRDLAAESPGDSEIKFALADAYSWNRKYTEAIDILKGTLIDPGGLRPVKSLAEIYLWDGQPDKARLLLERLAHQYPEDLDIKMMWGKSLYYTGESEKASRVFEKILTETGGE
jgi:tetratricopeptide (TPR) repeat protein